ncbi:PAS domain S-box protein [Pseudohoeflea suaedae]|uniref:histidine kinase n=1 Tax=Pseudohoeflea suaedae TaxID=877384 RepID=A0A4R5PNV3_9HYPH|nr:ATP-binding protein [Pseudohoeflea suaedae]TDH38311.1 PAS domain S-box protein [Pseudohoeflea suaedae]
MQYESHPFIDLAVHKDIRERFARGDALVVASPDLETIVWANGPAANLFGYASIYELIEDGIGTRPAIRRQIAGAVVGLARKDGQDFLIRVSEGFQRKVVGARVELIQLPGGAPAVLISAERDYPGGLAGRARQIISGFEEADAHVAVLDDTGVLLAASASFEAAELSASDLKKMARDVEQQGDRLIKRMIHSARGEMPAAIGRLTDDPALNLVFVVDTGASETDAPDEPASTDVPLASQPAAFDADKVREELAATPPPVMDEEVLPPPFAAAQDISASDDTGDGQPAAEDAFEDDALWAEVPPQTSMQEPVADRYDWPEGADEPDEDDLEEAFEDDLEEAFEDDDETRDETGDETGSGDISAEMVEDHEPETTAPEDEFTFDPDGRPVRFVWKIDRSGTFSELSSEFAEAVGPNAADILGRSFPDVARVFNLDPDHVITDLLSRRDTWSGKTVYWPIQGTGMVVPVDLAALPTYTRERRFDGFRGFGIVRIGEARDDDEAIGLALVPGPYTPVTRHSPPAIKDTPEDLADELARSEAETTSEEAVAESPRDDGPAQPVAELPATGASGDDLDATDEPTGSWDDVAAPSDEDDTPGSDDEPATVEEPKDDPFQGEKPAITFTPDPVRPESDKVIHLETRRAKARETLTPLEQAAFREIGEKLGLSLEAFRPPEAAEEPIADGADDEPETVTTLKSELPVDRLDETSSSRRLQEPEEVSALFDNVDGPASDDAEDVVESSEEPSAEAGFEAADAAEQGTETRADDGAGDETAPEMAELDDEDRDAVESASRNWDVPEVDEPRAEEADVFDEPDPASEYADEDLDPLEAHDGEEEEIEAGEPESASRQPHFGLPPRNAIASGMTEDVIDMIPAALLVHAGDDLIHGNPAFFGLTGYSSLSDLDEAGGLDMLLTSDEETGAMQMRHSDGELAPVIARLRSINWHDSQALLLSLALKDPMIPVAVPEDGPEAEAVDDAPQDSVAELPAEDAAIDEEADARLTALEIEVRELRSILETATDGVVIIGDDNRIRSMNGSAHVLFGYDDSETIGQPFAMLFAHESQRAVMDYLSGLAENGVSSVLNDGREVIGREANGGLSPLFMTIGRLSGSNGYCAVLRDITQWKRSEEELREAKRAAETANSHKSDFLARVSHEIRTPLNAIIGFSEMMVEERFGPIGSPRYLEYANDIGNSGKHVLDIVNDLLDISKIEAGEIDLDFDAVMLNDQLAECVSMLQPLANSQRVIIRTSLSATLPDVVADTRSVKQIALNLLSNAIRYTPSGGQIVVSTAYELNGNVVIRIRDTGIGMTRKELEQAMKPFGQVGPTPRKRGDGTGLGLPLTKAMVEANRAMFDIVSAPKEGTLVTITFPSQRVLAD